MKKWFEKLANELTTEARDNIKAKNFAIPKGRRYPIENKAHAENALARVDQFGSPGEKHQVYDAVAEKYPGLASRSSVPGVQKELARDKQGSSLKMAAMRRAVEAIYRGTDKLAGEVSIPEGGLRPGLLTHDLTQTMTPEDAALVRENLPWYRRSGLGMLPAAAIGAGVGGHAIPHLMNAVSQHSLDPRVPTRQRLIGAAVGSAALPALLYGLTRAGVYDNQALRSANKVIEQAKASKSEKEKKASPIEHPSGRTGAWEAFKGEAPSALGATAGAVGAGYLGVNPLVGAGLGYGVGSLPEAYSGIKDYLKRRAAKAGR